MPEWLLGTVSESEEEKKLKACIGAVIVALSLSGCASKDFIERPMQGGELVYSYPKQRPAWTVSKAEVKEGNYIVIGISHRFTTEKAARDDAMRSAASKAALYASSNVSVQSERKVLARGQENTPMNGGVRIMSTESIGAEQMISKLEASEWYLEQWKDGESEKPYWMAYVKAQVPLSSMD